MKMKNQMKMEKEGIMVKISNESQKFNKKGKVDLSMKKCWMKMKNLLQIEQEWYNDKAIHNQKKMKKLKDLTENKKNEITPKIHLYYIIIFLLILKLFKLAKYYHNI